jgi:hypothetical protein
MVGVLMVAKNTLLVIFGHLPTTRLSHQAAVSAFFPHHLLSFSQSSTHQQLHQQKLTSQIGSMYTLGILQTAFEISLILYFMIASLVGFYSLPFFKQILPQYKLTSMRTIILNCALFLVFSSALPVSSKILGLTRFDLLGHYGDLHWLANANIILAYNFVFATATGLCLINKFTASVRSELYNRMLILFRHAFTSEVHSTTTARGNTGHRSRRFLSSMIPGAASRAATAVKDLIVDHGNKKTE